MKFHRNLLSSIISSPLYLLLSFLREPLLDFSMTIRLMSNFKKPVDSTCWTQKGKRQCSKERGIQIKQRRREMYRARSVDKRELNLLERRTTYLHSRKQNPTSDSTEVSAFYQFNRELARQRAALTGASSSTLTTVNDSTLSDNGKDLHGRSPVFKVGKCESIVFKVVQSFKTQIYMIIHFLLGSTTGTCSEQYNNTMCNATSKENMCSVDMLLDMEAELLEKKKRKRNTVSCREYYCYKLQMRDDEENGVLQAGRVFQ
ncbi:uncharacterized protein LOC107777658 isoform X3 [Nicotiana tabacum]|uniref:Uncharacterized protein LOC107777658 isoform X3 n=1 Tax=Nicotiana tabacum TaxID=4097 RepID=A0AC58UR27_TOBAC